MSHLVGLGIDLVAVERMRTTLTRTPGFVLRVFSTGEIATATARRDPTESYAARFAAKEATLKALGLGLWDVPLGEIEVVGGAASGAPTLELHGAALAAADERGVTRWMLTLSHDGGVAAAVVAALG